MSGKPSVLEVAEYILAKYQSVDELKDDPITHMKLQKLVYYTQGFSLALYGAPMFEEALEAWPYGPVSPDLYSRYKKFDRNPIATDKTPDEAALGLSEDQIAAADLVVTLYGLLTAAFLSKMSHADEAWAIADSTGEKVLGLDAVKRSSLRRLAIRSTSTIPDENEIERQWRSADERGIPDSFDAFGE
jgi:uncharacterized phage-associated protein